MNDEDQLTYYETEPLKFLQEVASFGGSRAEFEKMIDAMSHISARAQRAYSSVIKTMFTQNTVLSNQTNAEVPECRLEILLLIARKSCTRLDVTRPELLNLEQQIIDLFSYLIPRSIGVDRERKLQIPTVRREEQTVTIDRSQPQQKERGFFR